MSDSSEGCVLDLFRCLFLAALVSDIGLLVAGIVYHVPFLVFACALMLVPAACLVAGVARRNRVLLRLGDLGGMLLLGLLLLVGGMGHGLQFLTWLGVAWTLFACILIVGAARRSRHEHALVDIAREWGLTFSPEDPLDILESYHALKLASRGKDPRVANVTYGEHGGVPVRIFDYSHGVPEDEEYVEDVSIMLVDTEPSFSYVAVWSKDFEDPLPATFLCREAETGDPAFDEGLCMAALDPDLARRLLAPTVTEFLVRSAGGPIKIEFAGHSILAHRGKRLGPMELRELAQLVFGLVERLPEDLAPGDQA